MALLSAGVILILQIKIARKRGVSPNTQMDMNNIHKVMETFRFKEQRQVHLVSLPFPSVLTQSSFLSNGRF